ncbi:Periodic tryptophan protein 2 [Linum perenne]
MIRTKSLKIAPTGWSLFAATTEGVLVYSVDESFIFDPTYLDIDVTPEVITLFVRLLMTVRGVNRKTAMKPVACNQRNISKTG